MKEISDIILKSIRDPRITGVVSITDVEVSKDNSFAKVFFSVFAPDGKKEKTINALEEHVGQIRYELGKRIRLRLTPELRFIPDDSLERGAKINDLINKISRGEI